MKYAGLACGASKAVIEPFSQGPAEEVGEFNIAVNALSPVKAVGTKGLKAHAPAAEQANLINWKMGKAVVFLARQDAHSLTGRACGTKTSSIDSAS
ncbi:MAG: hypothetical protein Q7T05_08460 [Dehalococcoidia bacterium]|nr:hypothetical protein [Dehalococcoidia bacterium]